MYQVLQYINYLFTAQTKYFVHSPFLYHFVRQVLPNKRHFYAYTDIEKRRAELLKDQRTIAVKDLGTGENGDRPIREIARNSAISKKHGQLLFRIVEKYEPINILELGTSLGIGTSYLASVRKSAPCITLEGCPSISAEAQNTFNDLGLKHINIRTGDFKNTLPEALSDLGELGLVFIDGNHTKEATLQYFEQLLPFTNTGSILIFDDIYWSKEMTEAWQAICNDERVTLSVDLYRYGLVFFKTEMPKQHFKLLF